MNDPAPQVPPIPPRPTVQADAARRGSLVPVVFASVIGVVCLGTLSLMSFGFAALVFAVGLVVFGIIAFHYLVWGWWLGEAIRREGQADAEETQPSQSSKRG